MFEFYQLDKKTRELMLQEVSIDKETDMLFYSPRLSREGIKVYPALLEEAIKGGDEETLATALEEYMKSKHQVKGKTIKVRSDAHECLADDEFNHYYVRAICRRALEKGKKNVIVYRAKKVHKPKASSEAMVGLEYDAEEILLNLRKYTRVKSRCCIPNGFNSGLSVYFEK